MLFGFSWEDLVQLIGLVVNLLLLSQMFKIWWIRYSHRDLPREATPADKAGQTDNGKADQANNGKTKEAMPADKVSQTDKASR